MDDADIPQSARTLILERIDSVVQLEVLLILCTRPDESLTPEAVSRELRIETSWAAGQLKELVGRKLVEEPAEGLFRYAPVTAELASAVKELCTAYAERRVRVISLIFSKPVDKLRTFADAFRIRKDKPGG